MATVLYNGHSIAAEIGETLFAIADRSPNGSREIATSCHRTGQCKECVVQVRSGNDALSPPTVVEAFLARHDEGEDVIYRLACQAKVIRSDAVIEVESFKQRLWIADTGTPASFELDPWVRREGDAIDVDGERIADRAGPIHGLAIDVGTTTVVCHVVDLETGRTQHVLAFENRQRFAGSTVLHRISYDVNHPGALHRTIIAMINGALADVPIDRESIVAVTVAGNPTMRDLFFGLDVQPIGQRPYMSQTQLDVLDGRRTTTALRVDAESLGLGVHPRACVYGLPLVSHHVGADTAAVLATIPIDRHERPFMVIDIGTNTEVAIGDRGRLLCASCPAGPAFEGGRLSCGMPAATGAITSLRRDGDRWEYKRIGFGPPRGLCGSGLVDALAELRTSEEMDSIGRFRDGVASIPIVERPRLSFTRSDASELAQAKAANAVGQMVLLRRFGVRASDIETFYLAGAFANHIDLARAQQIGLLAPVPDERIVRIGNASIEGAKAVLLSRAARDRVEALVRDVEHVELEQEPDFFELFVEVTAFEPLPDALPSA